MKGWRSRPGDWSMAYSARLYLGYISAISRLYLGYISAISRLYLAWGLVEGLQRAADPRYAHSQRPEPAVGTPRRTWLGSGLGFGLA